MADQAPFASPQEQADCSPISRAWSHSAGQHLLSAAGSVGQGEHSPRHSSPSWAISREVRMMRRSRATGALQGEQGQDFGLDFRDRGRGSSCFDVRQLVRGLRVDQGCGGIGGRLGGIIHDGETLAA